MAKAVKKTESQIKKAEGQIRKEMRSFDYDTTEYPIEVLVQKYLKNILEDDNEIFIPDYQREFVWNKERKSKFIESLLLGIPIPYIFLADVEGRLEIVDGSQRIRTLVEFLCDSEFVDNSQLKDANSKKIKEATEKPLVLENLERLTELNGFSFNELDKSRRRRFVHRSLKFIVLSEKTDVQSRKELFERINTGSDELTKMEVRKGTYSGDFYDFIKLCAQNPLFKKLCPISEKRALREEAEERILRYFAYLNNVENYKGEPAKFVNSYIKNTNKIFNKTIKMNFQKEFDEMLKFVDKFFPYGFKKQNSAKSTPRVRFEAISIGVSLALKDNKNLTPPNVVEWIESEEFKIHTRSDAANNKSKVKGRIAFVKDKLQGK